MEPDGTLDGVMATYDPKQGKKMKASADHHVNHSLNDAAAQAERQGDPHSHAIVLEPSKGTVPAVPPPFSAAARTFVSCPPPPTSHPPWPLLLRRSPSCRTSAWT